MTQSNKTAACYINKFMASNPTVEQIKARIESAHNEVVAYKCMAYVTESESKRESANEAAEVSKAIAEALEAASGIQWSGIIDNEIYEMWSVNPEDIK